MLFRSAAQGKDTGTSMRFQHTSNQDRPAELLTGGQELRQEGKVLKKKKPSRSARRRKGARDGKKKIAEDRRETVVRLEISNVLVERKRRPSSSGTIVASLDSLRSARALAEERVDARTARGVPIERFTPEEEANWREYEKKSYEDSKKKCAKNFGGAIDWPEFDDQDYDYY